MLWKNNYCLVWTVTALINVSYHSYRLHVCAIIVPTEFHLQGGHKLLLVWFRSHVLSIFNLNCAGRCKETSLLYSKKHLFIQSQTVDKNKTKSTWQSLTLIGQQDQVTCDTSVESCMHEHIQNPAEAASSAVPSLLYKGEQVCAGEAWEQVRSGGLWEGEKQTRGLWEGEKLPPATVSSDQLGMRQPLRGNQQP